MKKKTVVAVVGLPTSGKSSLAKEIAKITGTHFIDIDDGPANCAPAQEQFPYESEETRTRERARMKVCYTVLHAAVGANLENDFSVIVSATYSRHSSQDILEETVKAHGGVLRLFGVNITIRQKKLEGE